LGGFGPPVPKEVNMPIEVKNADPKVKEKITRSTEVQKKYRSKVSYRHLSDADLIGILAERGISIEQEALEPKSRVGMKKDDVVAEADARGIDGSGTRAEVLARLEAADAAEAKPADLTREELVEAMMASEPMHVVTLSG